MQMDFRKVYPPVEKFRFPEPVDPFGKASGRNLLTLGQLRVFYLTEFTEGEFGYVTLPVTSTRHLKPRRMG
jgi:hypothetical protein